MTIERLTKAARAAGYAMALNDEPNSAAGQKSISVAPAPGAAMLVATTAKPGTVDGWTTPWRQWAASAMPRLGA